jgi:protein O-GlcNAc transferase
VLCSVVPSVMLDPESFGAWMKILRSLPDAVLWLPAYSLPVAANLVREANAAGVHENRLLFAHRLSRVPDAGLHEACGPVPRHPALQRQPGPGRRPAHGRAGPDLRGRQHGLAPGRQHDSGGRIAAVRDAKARPPMSQKPCAWGATRKALQQLRQHLLAEKAGAPLFDLAARVREWEAAWAHMAERTRAGLAPAAFDVPLSPAGETVALLI